MEKIVQLTETEYAKLFAKAYLNESEIEKLAKNMYEKKGTFEIVLKLDCNQGYNEQISFYTYSYVKDYDGKFPLSEKDTRRIVDFVNSRALTMMEKKFGRQISNINIWNKRLELLRNWKIKFIGWTIFGWIAALSLLIISLFK